MGNDLKVGLKEISRGKQGKVPELGNTAKGCTICGDGKTMNVVVNICCSVQNAL